MTPSRDPHSETIDAVNDPIRVPEEIGNQPTVEEVMEEHRKLMRSRPPVATTDGPSERLPAASDASDSGASDAVQKMGLNLDGPTAAALAALQKELSEVRSDLSRLRAAGALTDDVVAESGPGGYPWQYYKRSNRPGDPMAGWVMVLPGGASPTSGQRDVGSFAKYVGKGFKALTRYGVAPVPSSVRGGASEQFAAMLQNGGASEFPLSQIVAYGWHIRPPVPGIIFPQLDESRDQIRHFTCEDCERETWFLVDDREASSGCFRHLRRDSRDGRHAYPRREALMILKSQGITPPGGQFSEIAARQDIEALREERKD